MKRSPIPRALLAGTLNWLSYKEKMMRFIA